jgi:hypothetical protein
MSPKANLGSRNLRSAFRREVAFFWFCGLALIHSVPLMLDSVQKIRTNLHSGHLSHYVTASCKLIKVAAWLLDLCRYRW